MLVASLLVVVVTACLLPPVDAPVSDPFRPPPCAWCPGNRGLEYEVAWADPVRAVLPGEVTFAGEVAGERYVTVRTPDGRLHTYGRLSEVAVDQGDRVRSRQRLGATTDRFMFTVRHRGEYLDPAPLFDERLLPRLVRLDGGRRPPPRRWCPTPADGWAERWGSPPGVR